MSLAFSFGCVLAIIGTVVVMRTVFRWRVQLLEYQVQTLKTDQKISESEFLDLSSDTTSTKRVLQKKIENVVYSIEGDENTQDDQEYRASLRLKADGEDLSSEKQEYGRILVQLISDKTQDFWIDFAEKKIYFIDQSELENGVIDYAFVYQFSIGDFANPQDDELGILKTIPSHLQSTTSIIGWSQKASSLILDTRGVDGCGGSGEISLLSMAGQLKRIEQYDIGCNVNRYQRYFGGMSDDRLIFAELDLLQENTDLQKVYSTHQLYAELKNVYLLDPVTLKREVVITDKNLLYGLDLSEKWRQPQVDEKGILFSGYSRDDLERAKTETDVQLSRKYFVYDTEKKTMREWSKGE